MKYENPEMEIVLFDDNNIVVTSTLVDTGTAGGGTGTGDDEISFGGFK